MSPKMDNPKRARSWKRLIQPRVRLKMVEPVLYSTAFRLRKKSIWATDRKVSTLIPTGLNRLFYLYIWWL